MTPREGQAHAEHFEVAVTDGVVSQEVTALDGVAEQAETADDRAVNRHQHIEYLPGDNYRSPDSVPLVIAADWPEARPSGA
jgi:hypothetical protein